MQDRKISSLDEIIKIIDVAETDLDLSKFDFSKIILTLDELKRFCEALLRKKNSLLSLNLFNNDLSYLNKLIVYQTYHSGDLKKICKDYPAALAKDVFWESLINVLSHFKQLKYLYLERLIEREPYLTQFLDVLKTLPLIEIKVRDEVGLKKQKSMGADWFIPRVKFFYKVLELKKYKPQLNFDLGDVNFMGLIGIHENNSYHLEEALRILPYKKPKIVQGRPMVHYIQGRPKVRYKFTPLSADKVGELISFPELYNITVSTYEGKIIDYLNKLFPASLKDISLSVQICLNFGKISSKDVYRIITLVKKYQELIMRFEEKACIKINSSFLIDRLKDIYYFHFMAALDSESYEEANKILLEIPPSSPHFIEARSKMFEAMYIAYRNSGDSPLDAFKETYEYCLDEHDLIPLTENAQKLFDSALLLASGKKESLGMYLSANQRLNEFLTFKFELQLLELYEQRKKIVYQNNSQMLFNNKSTTLKEIRAEQHHAYLQRKIVLIAREQTRISSLLNRVQLIPVDKAENFSDYAHQELSIYENTHKQLNEIKKLLSDSLKVVGKSNDQIQESLDKVESLIGRIQKDLIGNLGDNNYVNRFNEHQKVAKKIRDFQIDIQNIYLNRKDEIYAEIHEKPSVHPVTVFLPKSHISFNAV